MKKKKKKKNTTTYTQTLYVSKVCPLSSPVGLLQVMNSVRVCITQSVCLCRCVYVCGETSSKPLRPPDWSPAEYG